MSTSTLVDMEEWLESSMKQLSDIMSFLSSYGREVIILSWIVTSFALIYYFMAFRHQPDAPFSRKAQQAMANKKAFKAVEGRNGSIKGVKNVQGSEKMKITQIWVYPIKSIRGCSFPSATLTKEGFSLDRKFMLLKDNGSTPEKPRDLQNMFISDFAYMCLFHTAISDTTLVVTFRDPAKPNTSPPTLEIPLTPENFKHLEKLPVNMHHSPTTAYDMGERYGKWFSDIFGFKVILAYWGGNPRQVLGNVPGREYTPQGPKSSALENITKHIPILGRWMEEDDGVIAFNDCAPYLIITEKSAANVTGRLPEGVEMDITKFRANIVLSGSEEAFDEDFWGELDFGDGKRIVLTANCGRCNSLNVDYETGRSGTAKDGTGRILQLLQKDRRVDPGMKYSPIFGRYGFAGRASEGKVLRVGDEVFVERRNEERTRFYWPGVSTS